MRKNRKGRAPGGAPSGEMLIVVAIAVLIGTIAMLRLAVERERLAGAGGYAWPAPPQQMLLAAPQASASALEASPAAPTRSFSSFSGGASAVAEPAAAAALDADG